MGRVSGVGVPAPKGSVNIGFKHCREWSVVDTLAKQSLGEERRCTAQCLAAQGRLLALQRKEIAKQNCNFCLVI